MKPSVQDIPLESKTEMMISFSSLEFFIFLSVIFTAVISYMLITKLPISKSKKDFFSHSHITTGWGGAVC